MEDVSDNMKSNVDKDVLINKIQNIVEEMGGNRNNYIFLDDTFITKKLLIYDDEKLITFFCKKTKKQWFKKICFQSHFFSFHNDFLFGLIEKKIKKQEFYIKNIEDISLVDDDKQLFFIDDYGVHCFKIAKTDIYSFEQAEQVSKLKEFICNI